jgi:hypothetical protein
MRRRARFLRKARELALRDLGGLVLDMHRFGQSTSEALLAKLTTLRQLDAELRGLEQALGEGNGVTVLREVGIAACPRCAAIHGRDDRFCPGCGLAFDRDAERPIATSPVSVPGPQASTGGAQATQGASGASGASAPGPARPPAPGTPGAGTASTPSPSPAAPPTPTPPIKPTAPPVAARPSGPAAAAAPPADREREEAAEREEQPTQIVRPPAGGG